jgi:DNA-directed RNA polymerase subunit beta
MAIKQPQRNRAGRLDLGINEESFEFPNLIEAQVKSFDWFMENGFKKLFEEVNPVKDTMERMWTLEFKDFKYGKPNRSISDSIAKGLSYDAPVYVKSQLLNNKTGEIKEQEIFVVDLPVMTRDGYFVINGVRRVVTHQIVRAEGVLFEAGEKYGTRQLYNAILMPERGGWYGFEINKHNVVAVKLVQKRPKVLITELFRVLGYETDDEIRKLFASADTHKEYKYIDSTLARDFTKNKEEAVISVYNKLRPDESVTLESAEKYIKSLFFNARKFDLGRIGRYQLNKKLGTSHSLDQDHAKLYMEDLILIIKALIDINNGVRKADDIDHLDNRRIRSVGEVLVDQLRIGVRRVEKNIKDKMSMYGEDAKLTPSMLVSAKPIAAAMLSFFGQNQLSVFMEQTNILAELENKRKITASGPGGILKERAPFSLREVHHSQYSRFCPVTSPESQSIGVVTYLAAFARVNDFGFIEAPYVTVMQTAKNDGKATLNRMPYEDIEIDGKVVAKSRELITKEVAEKLAKSKDLKEIKTVSYLTGVVEYLDAGTEDTSFVSMSSVEKDEFGNIVEPVVPVRHNGEFMLNDAQIINYLDVAPSQQAGLGMALIPFVAHDDAKRALMASNQQRQAVPLVKQQAPLVGTGFEEYVARQSAWGVFAEDDGEVMVADGTKVIVKYKKLGTKEYEVTKFERSNHDTAFSQYTRVLPGQKLSKGDSLIDGPTMVGGELSLGINLKVALMFYEGYNYEDSAVISERLVKEDLLTSVHVKEHVVQIRDTELGSEMLTRDIPHVSERILSKLDDTGVVRVGARVGASDILAGVVGPRGEQELTAEEKLLRAIFGESATDVRDVSLRMPNGEKGIVIKTQVLSVENDDKLMPGVLKEVKVWVAETKKINYGDKIAGRHGDKSTIAAIKAVEDMPFTADGEPIDIVLTPTFIKRMNMGQAVEIHYGKYAKLLGEKLSFPLFEEINMEWLESELAKKGYTMDEKQDLYDGRTGEKFPRQVTVGTKYVLKLKHIADEKVHSRSTGPYTLVTQQPLGGKAQMGGQRFGEMEVWALEAHGAASALQEMLTIKSDDTTGRSQAYKAIIHGEKIENVNIPESFKVLVRELNALCLNIDLISKAKYEDAEATE